MILRADTTAKYHETPDRLFDRLRQLSRIQRDLLFIEALGGDTALVFSAGGLPSFSSMLKRMVTAAPGRVAQGGAAAEDLPTSAEPSQVSTDRQEMSRHHPRATERSTSLTSAIESSEIGSVARLFESGGRDDGAASIGYDPRGGTSYGIYQISSAQGSMREFLQFLDTVKPGWADRLRAAGPANTGSTDGRFPQEWKAIAREDPEGFAAVQHAFVRQYYFEPACEMIYDEVGIDIRSEPRAIQEMVWSMAVQHGVQGAVTIFKKAVRLLDITSYDVQQASSLPREEIVERVYDMRARNFTSSPSHIRRAVARRFEEEKALIRNALESVPSRLSRWG